MTQPIDLEKERQRRQPPDYVDIARLEAAATEIEAIADDIARESSRRFGTPDVLSNELCAYAAAIRRAFRQGD